MAWAPPWIKPIQPPVQPVDVLTKWKNNELPPEILQAAQVPSFDEWQFTIAQPEKNWGVKNPSYQPKRVEMRPATGREIPAQYTPSQPDLTNIPPDVYSSFAKIPSYSDPYGVNIAKPVTKGVLERWPAPKPTTIDVDKLRVDYPKLYKDMSDEEIRSTFINLPEKVERVRQAVAGEVPYLPLWFMPVGGGAKAGKGALEQGTKWAGEQLAKGIAKEDIIRGLSHLKIPEAEAKNIIAKLTGKIAPKIPLDFEQLHNHIARNEGFRRSSPNIVQNYLSKLKEIVNREAPQYNQLVDDAISHYRNGRISEAVTSSEEALSKLHKVLIRKSEGIIEVAPKVAETGTASFVENLKKAMPGYKGAWSETAALRKGETGKRMGNFETILKNNLEKGVPAPQAYAEAMKSLEGVMPTAEVPDLTKIFTHESVNAVMTEVGLSDTIGGFEKVNALQALQKLSNWDSLPPAERALRPYEMDLLDKIFALSDKKTLTSTAWQNFWDTMNVAKALEASGDISFFLRQGGPLVFAYPKQNLPVGWKMIKYFFSDDAAKTASATQKEFVTNSKFGVMINNSPLYLAPDPYIKVAVKSSKREEAFMTAFAEKIPWVKWSNRSFTVGGNEIRIKTLINGILEPLDRGGVKVTQEMVDAFATAINFWTGRGTLGRQLNSITPIINSAFFAMRYNISRPQAIYQTVKMLASKELPIQAKVHVARMFVGWFGSIATILGMAKIAEKVWGKDKVSVETNPLSTDFAKIKMGNTRLDPSAGFQQWIRFIAQFITGLKKNTTTGEVGKAYGGREQIILRFLRSKEAPFARLIHDLVTGTTFVGEDVEATPKFVKDYVLNMLASFQVMDMYDAVKQYGWLKGGLLSIPGFLGWGEQTYQEQAPKQPSKSEQIIPFQAPIRRK